MLRKSSKYLKFPNSLVGQTRVNAKQSHGKRTKSEEEEEEKKWKGEGENE